MGLFWQNRAADLVRPFDKAVLSPIAPSHRVPAASDFDAARPGPGRRALIAVVTVVHIILISNLCLPCICNSILYNITHNTVQYGLVYELFDRYYNIAI